MISFLYEEKNLVLNADYSTPFDISIPIDYETSCFNIDPIKIKCLCSVENGSSVNCSTITFNPHCSSTHTECIGHINVEMTPVSSIQIPYLMLCRVISVNVTKLEMVEEGKDLIEKGPFLPTDNVIGINAVMKSWFEEEKGEYCDLKLDAIVVRTPNNLKKTVYNGMNPPYFTKEAIDFFLSKGMKHLNHFLNNPTLKSI